MDGNWSKRQFARLIILDHNSSVPILFEIKYCWLCLINGGCNSANTTDAAPLLWLEILLYPSVGSFGLLFGNTYPRVTNSLLFSLVLSLLATTGLEKVVLLTNWKIMVIIIGGSLLVALSVSFILERCCMWQRCRNSKGYFILGGHAAIPLTTLILTVAAEASGHSYWTVLPLYAGWCIVAGMMLITGFLFYCVESIIIPTAITGAFLVVITLDLVYVQTFSTILGTFKASMNYLEIVTGVMCALVLVIAVIGGLVQRQMVKRSGRASYELI